MTASRCGQAGIDVRLEGIGKHIEYRNKGTTHHITINLRSRAKAGIDVRLQGWIRVPLEDKGRTGSN